MIILFQILLTVLQQTCVVAAGFVLEEVYANGTGTRLGTAVCSRLKKNTWLF